jgi:hypothetical protein
MKKPWRGWVESPWSGAKPNWCQLLTGTFRSLRQQISKWNMSIHPKSNGGKQVFTEDERRMRKTNQADRPNVRMWRESQNRVRTQHVSLSKFTQCTHIGLIPCSLDRPADLSNRLFRHPKLRWDRKIMFDDFSNYVTSKLIQEFQIKFLDSTRKSTITSVFQSRRSLNFFPHF